MSSLLEDMEKVERAAFLRKLRHDGTYCFAELNLNNVATGYWVRVWSLQQLCSSIPIINHRRVLRALRRCSSTPLLREEYAIDFPHFPLLVLHFAISTLNGIYKGDSDTFHPFKYPSAKRIPFATRLCYAVKKRSLPDDILRHILDFIVPTHVKPVVATMNFVPLNWSCTASVTRANAKLSIETLPDFADNIGAHIRSPRLARETCARLGEMIQCGSNKYRIVVTDRRVFRRSPLYALLCSIIHPGPRLVVYTTVSSKSRDICLLGDPSVRRETRVMDVIRLCIQLFKKGF